MSEQARTPDPRIERVGDSEFSRSADDRAPCPCVECVEKRRLGTGGYLSTRAEFLAWFGERCPNGYCICNPEKGIVCGQHGDTLGAGVEARR
jgi:hypothetical protein